MELANLSIFPPHQFDVRIVPCKSGYGPEGLEALKERADVS
jgi:hypothetical protein